MNQLQLDAAKMAEAQYWMIYLLAEGPDRTDAGVFVPASNSSVTDHQVDTESADERIH